MPGFVLLLNLFLEGIITGLLYALVALGFSLIWRICDVIHIAHGGVLLVAGTAMYMASQAGIPLVPAFLLGCVAAVATGLVIEEVLYRPMRRRGSGEFGMITVSLGVLILIEYSVVILLGAQDMSISAPTLRDPLIGGLPIAFDLFTISVLLAVPGLFLICALLVNRTAMGSAMRALASNAELATVVGMNTEAARRKAIVLGSLTTVPTALLMLVNTGMRPTDSLHIVLVAATVSIIGGRGSFAGALIGGILVGLAESLMVWYFPYGWRQVITFLPLYVLLLLRPQGLLGGRA